MRNDDLMNEVLKLEKQINILPPGNITKKKINNKDYYYHRITQNGKRTEKYISFEELPILSKQIEKRRKLEKDLKELKKKTLPKKQTKINRNINSKTMVIVGELLRAQIETVKKYKKRKCIDKLSEYVFGSIENKVFILYGLRRTGKTTMIRQIIAELSLKDFNKIAYIQISRKDTLSDINNDLKLLQEKGFKYVFIDEVTLIEDFIEGSALFSDVFASSGMKIILSGTDSLGFAFSKEEQLYDRCILLHTTFISYKEFEEVLGIKGIDEYIRYGGTMSLSGVNYNIDTSFVNLTSTNEYIDTAIARNIQHSLKTYKNGGHFRSLLELYEKHELTNVINRVVEDINHRFTKNVVEKTFISNDIAISRRNLIQDKNNPIDINEHVDLDAVTNGIKKVLDILEKEEQSIDIKDTHLKQIKEYLSLLDLITEIDLDFLPEVRDKSKITVVVQPGLRYAQAQAIIKNLLEDKQFQKLSAIERKYILDRLSNEICGRMMEEIVLLETKIANPDKNVFQLQFTIGEYDMVVYDEKTLSLDIYEIKYSKEQIPEQYRHIIDEEKNAMTEFRYGKINNRYVIYRGKNIKINDVQYLNVEEYLKNL